ncbi:MAG: hypothetical protein WA733_16295, partial [Methylocystis sp.]
QREENACHEAVHIWLCGKRVKVKSLSPASSKLSATARHFNRHRPLPFSPQPEDSPPYPFTDWPVGGLALIGGSLPNAVDSPLMKAIGPEPLGRALEDAHIQVYGWVNGGGNLRCLVPWFDGAILSSEWKDALWARFSTGAPDDVPWNNNNAEHAVKAFALLRRVIGGLTTEKSLRDTLVLQSVRETCKCKNVGFLDFLRSGSRDIDDFIAHGSKRRPRKAN